MNISKENDELVVKIPLSQEDELKIPNLVGIIAHHKNYDECSLSHMIYLDYKDSYQEGNPILMFDTKEELKEVCEKYGISLWEYPFCHICGNPCRGTFTMNDKGNVCYGCELKI